MSRVHIPVFAVLLLAAAVARAAPAADKPKSTRKNGPVELAAPAPRPAAERISLNLKDADLADFLATIHQLTGLNIVVYPEVRGTVTVTLKDVPWDVALDVILRSNGYGYVREGRVIRVGPVARLVGP